MKQYILSIKICLYGLCLGALCPALLAQTPTGKIVLEKTTPATAMVVTATQQVVLKPGFHATGDATSSFNARIGTSNSLSPVMQVASGSTITVPTSPSTSQNYIQTKTFLTATTDESNTAVLNSIQYFDGLGRPTQTITAGITPSGADLVSRVCYDDFGRQNITYLPVAVGGNFGLYADDSSIGSATSTLYGSDSRPYAETLLEASPLNRVTEQKKPGADWDNHSTAVGYETNSNDILWFTTSGNTLKRETSNYEANTLYKATTTDEDKKSATEYKDKLGHVVVKQSSTDVFTYYVYNDLEQLAYVLPPAFIEKMGSATSFDDANDLLKQFAYVYRYDEWGNCIYKKLPGCTPIYMIYDKADRLVLSQAGNQRKIVDSDNNAQWSVTKYDLLGRVTFTGVMYRSEIDSAQNYQTIRDVVSKVVVTDTYEGFSKATPMIENYYDNYDFLATGDKLIYDNTQEQNGYTAKWTIATGLLTGTKVYYLDGSGKYNTTAMYYDEDAKVVQTRSTNHLGGYDLVYNQYDFTGKVLKTLKIHKISTSNEIKELYTYSYDNGQRLTSTTYSLNGANPITLASNTYDEPGRLQTKKIGNAIETTNYNYNIQNHITEINGTNFSESLYYNTNTANLPDFTPCYNGNIAGMKWNIASENLGYQRAYSFDYDDLNRLTNSVYSGNNGSGVVSGTLGKYNEKLDYQNDKMGNLKALTRYENGTLLNDLTLTYTGNQLLTVNNSQSPFIAYGSEQFNDRKKLATEYAYDTNGSMQYDANGGISLIQYNLLNLPNIIQFTEGHRNQYTYDASGQKLKVENYTVNNVVNVPLGTITDLPANSSDYTKLTTDYIGNIVYENGALKEILLSEGYYQNGTFYYYLKDHLGDNRVTINSSGTVVEKSHYYPSGTRFYAESTNNSLNPIPYRYNGKEMEAMNGLNQMDYGARRRFSWAPIWTAHDPLSEDYFDSSPYGYCLGNAVNNIDPFGMDVWTTTDPATIRMALNSLNNGSDVTYNENAWSYKTDKQFLKKGEDEGYSVGLNYSAKTRHFYLGTAISSGGISIKDLEGAKFLSDPDSHYGIDGSYNLYTRNETNSALKSYVTIAGGELLGAAAGGLRVYEGMSALASRVMPKVANTALKAAIKAPAVANKLKTMGGNAMIYLSQKTAQASVAAAGAGFAEGGVKSAFGGIDTELGSSIFMNPISDASMNITGVLWNMLSLPTYP